MLPLATTVLTATKLISHESATCQLFCNILLWITTRVSCKAVILCSVLQRVKIEPSHTKKMAIMLHPYRVSSPPKKKKTKQKKNTHTLVSDWYLGIGRYPKPTYQNRYREGKKMVLEHLYRPSGSIKHNYEAHKCDTTIKSRTNTACLNCL